MSDTAVETLVQDANLLVEVLRHAPDGIAVLEVRDGVIQNPAILTFQGRVADYPHRPPAAA